MNSLIEVLKSASERSIAILDNSIGINKYVPLDLSKNNTDLREVDITDPSACQNYIDEVLDRKNGLIGYGGYLEERNLYNDKASFTSINSPLRNIHLGIDFWCCEQTKVVTPIDGTVHSFKFNNVPGDYGPTIILKHSIQYLTFYTLYGHLSLSSLEGLVEGKNFKAGEILGALGAPDINVNYAPHLHFQIIYDMEGFYGDYPGVCSKDQLMHYKLNCPDPNFLLKLY